MVHMIPKECSFTFNMWRSSVWLGRSCSQSDMQPIFHFLPMTSVHDGEDPSECAYKKDKRPLLGRTQATRDQSIVSESGVTTRRADIERSGCLHEMSIQARRCPIGDLGPVSSFLTVPAGVREWPDPWMLDGSVSTLPLTSPPRSASRKLAPSFSHHDTSRALAEPGEITDDLQTAHVTIIKTTINSSVGGDPALDSSR